MNNDRIDITQTNELLDSVLSTEARQWGKARHLPSAIRVTERLEPVGGFGIPVYPASYPSAVGEPIYDLNGKLSNAEGQLTGYRHCVIDSYQSQANRMEPAFKDQALKQVIPQYTITVPRKTGDSPTIEEMNALDIAHRVADFRIRLSDQPSLAKDAIKSFDAGDALPLIRFLPTSILFGFWDSRDLGTKHARILMSRIDANDVIPCQKHSLYSGQYSKDEFVNLLEIAPEDADDKILSERGFSNAPGSGLGGVLVNGGITRTSILSLTDIARIHCMNGTELDHEKTNAARRYLFCLGLIAEAYQRECGNYNLRSGCELRIMDGETYALQGGAEHPGLLEFCKDQQALLLVATDAARILGISSAATTLVITTDSLKAEFNDAKGKKEDKKVKAAAKKAAKKALPASASPDQPPA